MRIVDREWVIRLILGLEGIEISAFGSGKAYYNGVEINTGGTGDRIAGARCHSAQSRRL